MNHHQPVYQLLAAAVERYDRRTVDEVEVEEVMLRDHGLYLNTTDGKQYRVLVAEVIRP